EETVKAISWSRYNARGFSEDNDKVIDWPARFTGQPIRGRAFLPDDAGYISTLKSDPSQSADKAQVRLHRTGGLDGRVEQTYPPYNAEAWATDVRAGNIVVAGSHVVVASAESVDVYTDLDAAREKFDTEIAAAPKDPDVRLHYSEVMFVAGETALSVQKLDEAIELLGGLQSMRNGASRDRLFNTTLRFAERLAHREDPNARDVITSLFERAAAAAYKPSQQVRYRMSLGEIAARQKDWPVAVNIYQEVLDDEALGGVGIAYEQTGQNVAARRVAQQLQAEAIRSAGRSVY